LRGTAQGLQHAGHGPDGGFSVEIK
jgi:hypothetical protein